MVFKLGYAAIWKKKIQSIYNIDSFRKSVSRSSIPTYQFSSVAQSRWTIVGKVMSLLFNMLSQFTSVAQSCPTLSNPMDCSTPGLSVHHQLPEFTQTHVHWVGDAIQPPHPLSSPSPPTSIITSIRVFSNESVLHIRWPKYWSFSISPSKD